MDKAEKDRNGKTDLNLAIEIVGDVELAEEKKNQEPMTRCPCCLGLGYVEESIAQTVSAIH